MSNLVERQAVIEAFSDWSPVDDYERRVKDAIIDTIKRVPSAEKQLFDWIPTDERLPDEGEEALVCGTRGAIYRAKNTELGWRVINRKEAYYCNPVAWVPLPKPYVKGD